MEDHLKNAQIELQHILLELNSNRTHHMRHFIDSYFCYSNNFINKNGNAKWQNLLWTQKISNEAKKVFYEYETKLIKYKNETTKRNSLKKERDRMVTRDHTIPLRVVIKIIENEHKISPLSIEKLQAILDENIFYTTITKEEDGLLRSKKLTSQMPQGYYDEQDHLYQKWNARYIFAGINL